MMGRALSTDSVRMEQTDAADGKRPQR